MKPIRIALTKGRLEKKTMELFESLGYDCTALHNKGRKLILPIPDANLEIVLAKAADVITYVEHGVCDLGVVGKDTIMEYGGTFFEVTDLGFGRCRFALAGKAGENFYAGHRAKRIASKYPNVTRRFFDSKGLDVEIIKIEGSVELAPLVGLADAIVDIVETGSTLRENGLDVYEEVAPISARLIANTVSLKLHQQPMESIINQIESAVQAVSDQKG
jgi:ATP phosphoribosyltransferase